MIDLDVASTLSKCEINPLGKERICPCTLHVLSRIVINRKLHLACCDASINFNPWEIKPLSMFRSNMSGPVGSDASDIIGVRANLFITLQSKHMQNQFEVQRQIHVFFY